MFALPFAVGPAPTASLKSADVTAGSPGLDGLLAGLAGAEGGFSAELQALLMQLTPQMLARLESLVEGGMGLPQAARQLLSETNAAWPQDLQHALFERELGKSAVPQVNKNVVASAVTGELQTSALPGAFSKLGSESAQALAGLPLPTALPAAVTQLSQGNGMSPQLAASLLDMGLPQQVGSRAWSGAVAERVMWMAQGDQQFARLSLNPPQLGPLEIRVSINREQASITFLSSHAAVREALDAAMPRLRELFDQQAMSLVHAEVADPGAQRDSNTAMSSGNNREFGPGDGEQPRSEQHDALVVDQPFVSARGLVDLFA
jgi:flagellar hook-length control protein FliK